MKLKQQYMTCWRLAVVITSKSLGTLFKSKSLTHPPTKYASNPAYDKVIKPHVHEGCITFIWSKISMMKTQAKQQKPESNSTSIMINYSVQPVQCSLLLHSNEARLQYLPSFQQENKRVSTTAYAVKNLSLGIASDMERSSALRK